MIGNATAQTKVPAMHEAATGRRSACKFARPSACRTAVQIRPPARKPKAPPARDVNIRSQATREFSFFECWSGILIAAEGPRRQSIAGKWQIPRRRPISGFANRRMRLIRLLVNLPPRFVIEAVHTVPCNRERQHVELQREVRDASQPGFSAIHVINGQLPDTAAVACSGSLCRG
jgi:hypothetical protein